MQFLINVLASTIASLIVAVLAWATRRIWLYGFYSEVAKVYRNNRKGLKAINKDIQKSTTIKILTLRGISFINKDFYHALQDNQIKQKNVEFITSDINDNDVIIERAITIDTTPEEYKEDIRHVLEKLKQLNKNHIPKLKIFTHKFNSPFQLIILDQCVYVSYYWVVASSAPINNVNNSQMVKYKSNTGAYGAFLSYYDSVKKSSTPFN